MISARSSSGTLHLFVSLSGPLPLALLPWHLQFAIVFEFCPPPPVDPTAHRFGSLARAPPAVAPSVGELYGTGAGLKTWWLDAANNIFGPQLL